MTEQLESVDEQKSNLFRYLRLPAGRARAYYVISVVLALWVAGYVFFLAMIYPTAIYWISYYAVNYEPGFVRRGLAGHVIGLFPDNHYFTVAYTLVWGSFALYCVSLAVLGWYILTRGVKSERRLLVALMIPVLPFTVTFAIFGPRPELFAVSGLILFGITLNRVTERNAAITSSVVFGAGLAALAFVHEMIPIQLALGAVLAVCVLAPPLSTAARWMCMVLSAGPGVLAAVFIVVSGRRDVGAQICEQVPHRVLQNPFALEPEQRIDYMLGRLQSTADYHDWVCQNIVPYFDADVSAWFQTVVNVGLPGLIAGFVHGLVVCVGTLWLIRYFTGVHWKSLVGAINGGIVVPLLALAMMIPVFATGVDWIRWWTMILTNVAVVYLIYAANQPEIETAVTKRQWRTMVVIIALLACAPLSAGPGYFSDWITI